MLQQEITELQQALKPLQRVTQFADFDLRLNEKLNRLVKEIITGKKEKMLGDKIDYETNNVYVWKQVRQWSRASAGGVSKHVSFSDTDFESWDDTLAASDSDLSLPCSAMIGCTNRIHPLYNGKKRGKETQAPQKGQKPKCKRTRRSRRGWRNRNDIHPTNNRASPK